MSELALPPVIGTTENALRSLLRQLLSSTAIGGYDEWVYLNIRDAADDVTRAEASVADALKQPVAAAAAARSRLFEAGLLDAAGALTQLGHDELRHGRELISATTRALTAGIEPARLRAAVEILDTVRLRAENHLRDADGR